MTDLQFAEEILERLQDRNPRFHGKAYLFLLSALHSVLAELEEPRHISGEELAHGVRDLALNQYGPMARTVLGHWGIHGTEDLGEIVFAMVECGVLIKAGRRSQGRFPGPVRFRGGLRDETTPGEGGSDPGGFNERGPPGSIPVGLNDLPAVGKG